MKLPEGKTEAEVLDAIEKAVRLLASSFVFGYYDIDDIRQQARLFGFQALDKYDPSRPLANFIYVHIRNRLVNFKRDRLRRNDAPCLACREGRYCGPDGEPCKRFADWRTRNNAKANLMRPVGLDHVSDDKESATRSVDPVYESVAAKELLQLVDEKLPLELRVDYLKMREGVTLPKPRRQEILDVVKDILKEGGAWPENEDL